jgi:predicted transposase/invertase (TIGR01784 family)
MFDYVTSDPEMRELIRMREDGLHDYNSDINSAKRRGKMEGKKETALNALSMGLSLEQISKLTGLSPKEIESLDTNK